VRFVNVGFNNIINADRTVAVVASDSAPAKRMIQEAKDSGRAIDCTCGKKTQSIIIMDSDHIILCALHNETMLKRLGGAADDEEESYE
jgi:extracellular matrix regulatory protein A